MVGDLFLFAFLFSMSGLGLYFLLFWRLIVARDVEPVWVVIGGNSSRGGEKLESCNPSKIADSFAVPKLDESDELEFDSLGGEGERSGTSFFGLMGEALVDFGDGVLFFGGEVGGFDVDTVKKSVWVW